MENYKYKRDRLSDMRCLAHSQELTVYLNVSNVAHVNSCCGNNKTMALGVHQAKTALSLSEGQVSAPALTHFVHVVVSLCMSLIVLYMVSL